MGLEFIPVFSKKKKLLKIHVSKNGKFLDLILLIFGFQTKWKTRFPNFVFQKRSKNKDEVTL